MSSKHADTFRHIANLILRKYNYLTNSFFSLVHYYNDNRSSSAPSQNQRGTISVHHESRKGRRAPNHLQTIAKVETGCIGTNKASQFQDLISSASRNFHRLRGIAA
jgi:hypothetical protein